MLQLASNICTICCHPEWCCSSSSRWPGSRWPSSSLATTGSSWGGSMPELLHQQRVWILLRKILTRGWISYLKINGFWLEVSWYVKSWEIFITKVNLFLLWKFLNFSYITKPLTKIHLYDKKFNPWTLVLVFLNYCLVFNPNFL